MKEAILAFPAEDEFPEHGYQYAAPQQDGEWDVKTLVVEKREQADVSWGVVKRMVGLVGDEVARENGDKVRGVQVSARDGDGKVVGWGKLWDLVDLYGL